MMTHTTVLTGTALLALPPMFPWRAQVLTAAHRHQKHFIQHFSVHALPGNLTHDLSVASTTINCLSYRNTNTSFSRDSCYILLFLCMCNMQVNLQCSRVSWAAHTLSCDVMACGVVLAQTFLLAVIAVGGTLT